MSRVENRLFRFNSFKLDVVERELRHGETTVQLTPKVFDTLVYLVENRGHLVTKDELLTAVWPDSFVEEGNITRSIHTLRKTLCRYEPGTLFIQTIPTKGYRFIAENTGDKIWDSERSSTISVEIPGEEGTSRREVDPNLVSSDWPMSGELHGATIGSHRKAVVAAIALFTVFVGAVVVGYLVVARKTSGSSSVQEVTPGTVNRTSTLYWEMNDAEKMEFVKARSRHVQSVFDEEPVEFDPAFLFLIRVEIDDFISRNSSVSDRPFREPITKVFGRAAEDAETVADYFESAQLNGPLGIYLAMVESEFHQCLIAPTGSIGLFQLPKHVTDKYKDVSPKAFCDIDQNAEVASRWIADISNDVVAGRTGVSLTLLTYKVGTIDTIDYFRQLRSERIWERSAWAILRNKHILRPALSPAVERFLARIYGSAIIGETPTSFGLTIEPLSKNRTPRV